MKYAALSYSTLNIGDDIQTVAAMRFLPRIDLFIDRDQLDKYCSSEKTIIILNGFFSDFPSAWPPSSSIAPIFAGFHLARQAASTYGRHRTYFSQHAPIGCRDHGTVARFAAWDVPAFV